MILDIVIAILLVSCLILLGVVMLGEALEDDDERG